MPSPAGGGPEPLALFTLAELDAWTQSTVPVVTGTLILELVTTAIRGVVGADRYDALTDLTPLKLIALEVARRVVDNPGGLRSLTVGQVTESYDTSRGAAGSVAYLTSDERDQLDLLLGRSSRAFTIRPAGSVPSARACPW